MSMFLEEINACFSRVSKDINPHQRGRALSNPLRARIEQKSEGRVDSPSPSCPSSLSLSLTLARLQTIPKCFRRFVDIHVMDTSTFIVFIPVDFIHVDSSFFTFI